MEFYISKNGYYYCKYKNGKIKRISKEKYYKFIKKIKGGDTHYNLKVLFGKPDFQYVKYMKGKDTMKKSAMRKKKTKKVYKGGWTVPPKTQPGRASYLNRGPGVFGKVKQYFNESYSRDQIELTSELVLEKSRVGRGREFFIRRTVVPEGSSDVLNFSTGDSIHGSLSILLYRYLYLTTNQTNYVKYTIEAFRIDNLFKKQSYRYFKGKKCCDNQKISNYNEYYFMQDIKYIGNR